MTIAPGMTEPKDKAEVKTEVEKEPKVKAEVKKEPKFMESSSKKLPVKDAPLGGHSWG